MFPILCWDAFIALLNLMHAVGRGRTPESPHRQTSTITEAVVESSRVQIVSHLQDQVTRELMNRKKEGSLRCQIHTIWFTTYFRDTTWVTKPPREVIWVPQFTVHLTFQWLLSPLTALA